MLIHLRERRQAVPLFEDIIRPVGGFYDHFFGSNRAVDFELVLGSRRADADVAGVGDGEAFAASHCRRLEDVGRVAVAVVLDEYACDVRGRGAGRAMADVQGCPRFRGSHAEFSENADVLAECVAREEQVRVNGGKRGVGFDHGAVVLANKNIAVARVIEYRGALGAGDVVIVGGLASKPYDDATAIVHDFIVGDVRRFVVVNLRIHEIRAMAPTGRVRYEPRHKRPLTRRVCMNAVAVDLKIEGAVRPGGILEPDWVVFGGIASNKKRRAGNGDPVDVQIALDGEVVGDSKIAVDRVGERDGLREKAEGRRKEERGSFHSGEVAGGENRLPQQVESAAFQLWIPSLAGRRCAATMTQIEEER